jgi:hypothetical protein
MQVPLLPGVGAEASRGRLDPEKGPWRAVGKLQVARVNRRQTCTGTSIGPSTVLTAAHCVFNAVMSRFRPAGFRNGRTAWRRASRPDSGRRPARRRSTAFRDGRTAWRRWASRNPAAPRNAVSPWEAGAPRSAASRWEAAANPWLGAIARCSRTGSSNPSPSSGESANHRFLSGAAHSIWVGPRSRAIRVSPL